MNRYTVVIPNRFEEVIQPLIKSLITYEPIQPDIVIVADNHDRNYGFDMIRVNGDFIFSKSVNIGIEYTNPCDVILLNDDVRLLDFNTFNMLNNIAYADQSIGILTPIVHGGCGNLYMRADRTDLWANNYNGLHYCNGLLGGDRITFACVYLKRKMLDDIGPFDENFIGYGYDDADMCIRAVQGGWRLAITNLVEIQHGNGGVGFVRGSNWNQSFVKNRIGGSRRNLEYLMSKYPFIKDHSKFEQTNGR